MIQLAKEQNGRSLAINISFNTQSQRMFLALGFQKVDEGGMNIEIDLE